MALAHDPLDSDAVARQAASLKRLARALVGDPELADDLAQDAWVAALTRPPRASAALGAWLATVVRRLARNAARAGARRAEHEERARRAPAQQDDALALERLELQRRVLAHVTALREPYRTAVYLRYWEELGPREIAVRLGVPLDTVKSRLARGLAELRGRLDAESGGARAAWMSALAAVAFPGPTPPGAAALPHASAPAPLSHAWSAGPLAAGTSALIGGSLVTKKLVLAAAAILLVVAGWRWIGVGGARPSPAERAALQRTTEELSLGPRPTDAPRLEPIEIAPDERAPVLDAAELATGELVVHVKWSDGAPAEDVAIAARCDDDPAPRLETFVATSDERGIARFPALFAGAVKLHADRGHDLDARVEPGERREIDFVLPRGEDVLGRVALASGEPVGGAEIWLGHTHGRWPLTRRIATAAADGTFRVRAVSESSQLGARADGHAPSLVLEVHEMRVGASGARDVVLVIDASVPSGAVTGRVLDPLGAPVAGAQVKIGARGGGIRDLPSGLRALEPEPVAATTDASGAFRSPGGLRLGELPAHVTARGWPVWSGSVLVQAGATTELVVQLEHGATIVGTVFDARGVPAADVEVIASEEIDGGWHHDEFPPPETTTDEHGRFRLDWVPPGDRMLVASDWRRPEIGKALGRVPCANGATVGVELVLTLGATIEGRVADAHGAPLAGWRVHANPGLTDPAHPRSARTGADGWFVVPNLDERFRYELQVRAPGDFQVRERIAEVAVGARDLEIVVEDATAADAFVRGELRDADGRVPRDVLVCVYAERGREGAIADLDASTGQFRHGPLTPGRYVVRVQRGGQFVLQSDVFDLDRGETRDLGALRIGGSGRIVVDLRGVPTDFLKHVDIDLERAGFSSETLRLEDGRFRSRELAPGTWTLSAGRGGGWFLREQEVEIVPGETIELTLAAELAMKVPITCRAEDPDASWERIEYEVRDATGERVLHSSVVMRTDDGRYRLAGLALPPGRYELAIRTDTGLRATDTIELAGPSCPLERELVLR